MQLKKVYFLVGIFLILIIGILTTYAQISFDPANNQTFYFKYLNTTNITLNTTTITDFSNLNVSCAKITGSPDTDFCTDATGTGGGGINVSTTTCSGTDKISAINNATGAVTCSTDQTGAGTPASILITGRGTASITVDEWYHPEGGVLVAGDTDESQFMRLPYAGTLHNLSFMADAVQGSGDTCILYVTYNATANPVSAAVTALYANISNVNQYAINQTASVSVAAGSYIKILMDEQGGTCSLIPSWSFVYTPT